MSLFFDTSRSSYPRSNHASGGSAILAAPQETAAPIAAASSGNCEVAPGVPPSSPNAQQLQSDSDYVNAIREHNARVLSRARGERQTIRLIHLDSSPSNSPLHHAIWLVIAYLRGEVELAPDDLREVVATVGDAVRGVTGCESLESALQSLSEVAGEVCTEHRLVADSGVP